MEHPVPRNITSFEFHLVGDMTLKQFTYLAVGLISGYLAFVLLFASNPFIAIPVIALFVISGAAFAFLPILDRPLDHWVIAFFKAVYSPTRGRLPLDETVFKNRLPLYLSSIGTQGVPKLSRLAPAKFDLAPTIKTPTAPVPQVPPVVSAPKIQSPQDQLQSLQKTIAELQHNQQLNQAQLDPLLKQYAQVSQSLQKPQPIPQPTQVIPPTPKPPSSTLIPKEPKKQLTLTSFPNIINGVISDEEGNFLEGVIVIIHDSNDIPVRALKTNKLGQFSGATPLPSGKYTVTFEKEGFELGSLQVNLNDEVMQPLIINTKKEKNDS